MYEVSVNTRNINTIILNGDSATLRNVGGDAHKKHFSILHTCKRNKGP